MISVISIYRLQISLDSPLSQTEIHSLTRSLFARPVRPIHFVPLRSGGTRHAPPRARWLLTRPVVRPVFGNIRPARSSYHADRFKRTLDINPLEGRETPGESFASLGANVVYSGLISLPWLDNEEFVARLDPSADVSGEMEFVKLIDSRPEEDRSLIRGDEFPTGGQEMSVRSGHLADPFGLDAPQTISGFRSWADFAWTGITPEATLVDSSDFFLPPLADHFALTSFFTERRVQPGAHGRQRSTKFSMLRQTRKVRPLSPSTPLRPTRFSRRARRRCQVCPRPQDSRICPRLEVPRRVS